MFARSVAGLSLGSTASWGGLFGHWFVHLVPNAKAAFLKSHARQSHGQRLARSLDGYVRISKRKAFQ
jgi:hypothetical protein